MTRLSSALIGLGEVVFDSGDDPVNFACSRIAAVTALGLLVLGVLAYV